MRTINETWSGRRTFEVTGKYFELLDTVSPVDVYAYDDDGNEIAAAFDVEQGFFIDRRGTSRFNRIAIETSTSEAVKFVYTDGTAGTRTAPVDIQDDATTRGTYAQDGVSIAASDTLLLAANSARKFLAIQNTSASADLYVRFDGVAATADGESLKIEAGGYFEPRVVPTGQIRGISSSGTITVHVIEA